MSNSFYHTNSISQATPGVTTWVVYGKGRSADPVAGGAPLGVSAPATCRRYKDSIALTFLGTLRDCEVPTW